MDNIIDKCKILLEKYEYFSPNQNRDNEIEENFKNKNLVEINKYLDFFSKIPITNDINNEMELDETISGIVQYKELNLKEKSIAEYTKEELNNLENQEISNKLIDELEKIKLNNETERQEFFKFLSRFNSTSYSFNNQFLLFIQAKFFHMTPVFASMKEWNEKEKVRVKPDSKALFIWVPLKYDTYYKINSEGQKERLPYTIDKAEKMGYEKLVNKGLAIKEVKLKFKFSPQVFSIDQTNITEDKRVKLLQRFNAYNNSSENESILNKSLELTKQLGIDISFYEQDDAILGFINFPKTLKLKKNMPVDTNIAVLTHELGHYFFHRHEQNEIKVLRKEDEEIQAQLFSHLVLEGIGVNSENEFSLKYINGYLAVDEKKNDVNISNINKSRLNAHLAIVYNQAKSFIKIIKQELVNEQDIKNLQDFLPDFYKFDNKTLKARIELNPLNRVIKNESSNSYEVQKKPMIME